MAEGDTAQAFDLTQYTVVTRDRPIGLALAQSGGLHSDLLLPQRLIGKEAMFDGFVYRVLCVSKNAQLALKEFIGLPAELRIVTDRGQQRRICGIVTEMASGQSDGALATYQLTIRDALSVMDKRINTRIFRNQNELDVVKIILDEWLKRSGVLCASFDFHIEAGLDSKFPKREFIMQHNESDAAFIRRLLQRRGIAWFFRSGLPQRGDRRSQVDAIGHTLVMFKDPRRLPRNMAESVRFHRDAATEQRDAVTGWSAARYLQPGSSSLHSWDYKQPSGGAFMAAHSQSVVDQGKRGNEVAAMLDDYCVIAPHAGNDARDLGELADARMAHYEYEAKCFLAKAAYATLQWANGSVSKDIRKSIPMWQANANS